MVLLLAGISFGYYRYTFGVIEPDEIYPEALGQNREQIEGHLGKPRRLDDFGNGTASAFWQGRVPYSWTFSIWYIRDVAVHIQMPADLIGLEIDDIKGRIGPSVDWKIVPISHHEQPFPAWVNEDRSVAIYDTGLDYNVASKDSIFWE